MIRISLDALEGSEEPKTRRHHAKVVLVAAELLNEVEQSAS
jgi:hypothetical protein